MPRFVIERDLPGAGRLSDDELAAIARRSCDVLRELGPDVQWLHSYVTEDRIYCVYVADSEDLILQHARRGGFPADVVARVHAIIDASTAEAVPRA